MIDGIKIIELKTHNDERGFFKEIIRLKNYEDKFTRGQLSHSMVKKNVLKAWHGHKIQSQWNYVVSGLIKVVLYDNNSISKTYKNSHAFYVGEGYSSIAYFFAPGVLHSYQCLIEPMHIIYLTSGTYDIEEEIRIKVNDPSIVYSW